MPTAHVRLYAELNDFVPTARRARTFEYAFDGRPAVKDALEAIGVPHVEIDLLLVDGEPVGFGHPLEDGARVAAYPAFTQLDVPESARLQPAPLETPRFLLDGHLGRLAAYLRLLGFDTAWQQQADDVELARQSAAEDRILLSRDLGLLKRSVVRRGRWVRATNPRDQLAEVLRRFALDVPTRPFSRCLRCNATLAPVAKEEVAAQLPPTTRERVDDFSRCTGCGQIYWQGAHAARLRTLVALASGRSESPSS